MAARVVLHQKTLQVTPEQFELVRAFMLEHTGNVIEPGKQYLVEFRLAPVVDAYGFGSISFLLTELAKGSDPQVKGAVIDAMTSPETGFFRDTTPFDVLRNQVVPALVERNAAERRLRIWSAGCATGQEPYSIAMVRHDAAALEGWHVRILGTDVSPACLMRAQLGRYAQIEVNRGVSADLLERHFERDDVAWKVRPHLKRGLQFRQHDLASPWRDDLESDVVFARNVLTVFDKSTRRGALDRLAAAVVPGGFLFVGRTEAVPDLHDAFEPFGGQDSCCYRRR